jgi:hypothetical protein
LGTYFLRYSRENEKQADLLGVQLMARAGYNPLDLMHLFQTIEKQGGGGPQFLSDRPNPGNREACIKEEASHLRIEGAAGDSREFARVQDRLRSMSPAPTTEQATRQAKQKPSQTGQPVPDARNIGTRVAPPSSRYKSYSEGNLFRFSVPRQLARGGDELLGEVRARRRLRPGAGSHDLYAWRGAWLHSQRDSLASGSHLGIH